MPDRYSSFAALEAGEVLGVDYRIRIQDRGTSIIIIAPHGGYIEPVTSQIAEAIAAEDLSLYLFEGVRSGRPHSDLHITSSKFDEPQGVSLVGRTETAIAVHGRSNDGRATIWMGGRDVALRNAITAALKSAGFEAAFDPAHLPGLDSTNICNRSRNRAGVQLELPRSLRDQVDADPERMATLVSAIRSAALDNQGRER